MSIVRKKALAIALAALLLIGILPMSAFATPPAPMTIRVSEVNGAAGATVNVTVALEDNPGISSLKAKVAFDSTVAELLQVEYNAQMSGQSIQPASMASPVSLTWVSPFENYTQDGVFATLTFRIREDAGNKDFCAVNLTYDPDDIFDITENNVSVTIVNGGINILQCVPGDINGDGKTNNKDLTRFFQYLANWNVTVNTAALDTNGDGKVNNKDLTRLFQYLADWDVAIYPQGTQKCQHNLVAVPAVAPTGSNPGNIAYWRCTICGKYYADANASREITLDETVIPPTGEPDEPETGYLITYDIANSDPYLEQLVARFQLTNNPGNPKRFTGEADIMLKNLSTPGYRFIGWYDGAGQNANQIRKISAGTNYDVELYAHWEKIEYTIQLKSSLFLEENRLTYTVDEGKVLPTPKLSNYVFTGWTDDEGNLISGTTIPVGTTGNFTLTANWTSERNKTWTKPVLDDPYIEVDEENNMIYFAYEIGEIQNVPVYTVKDFGYIASEGVTKTETCTFSMRTDETMMQSFTTSLMHATTESSNWTLSQDWSQSTDIDEEWCEERGLTREEGRQIATSDTGTWNVSNSKYGSLDVTSLSSNQSNWENQVKISNSSEDQHTDKTSASLHSELSAEGFGVSAKVSGDLSAEDTDTYTNKRGLETGNSSGGERLTSNSATLNSGWNSSTSYGGSHTASTAMSNRESIYEGIAQKCGYSIKNVNGESRGQSSGITNQSSSTDSYVAGVTHSTVTEEQVTRTWTTQGTKAGYHRWVKAATAHVFGVVGYDIVNKTYFVSTYAIMDDDYHDFEDYSYTSSKYDDMENGVIPFEVPYDIARYVSEYVLKTDKLRISTSGIVEQYLGEDTLVVIPEYFETGDGDVIKVTGISENAFQNKTGIEAVILSDYITDIPANTFKGCTSLCGIIGGSVTSIGAYAFSGCTSLVSAAIDEKVTYLGEKAFEGVTRLIVSAANADVAVAAANSGANRIILHLNKLAPSQDVMSSKKLTVPDGTAFIRINGGGRSFNNLSIESYADETVISKLSVVSGNAIPMIFHSGVVSLNQVSVQASGLGMVFTANNTEIGLQGTVNVISSTTNAVLSKSARLSEINPNVTGLLNVAGKILVCGDIENRNLMSYQTYVLIDADTFDRMLNSYTLYFDPNGGTCNVTDKIVANSTPIGELPVPTRTGYTFEGWYTAGGEQVSEQTVFSSGEDVTLTARWAEIYVTALSIEQEPQKTSFYTGDTFTFNGLCARATYNDGTWEIITPTAAQVSGPDMTTAGTKNVTVTYEGKTAVYSITITDIYISVSKNTSTGTSGYITATASVPCGTVTWSSSNANVASVDNSGKVTLKTQTGTAVITATVNNNGVTKSASFSVTVSNSGGTKFRETSSSSSTYVLYGVRPGGYDASLPVTTGSIPSYTTNAADITNSSTNTATGRVVVSNTSNGVAGYVYYQFNYNSSTGGDNIYKIINYQEGWRNCYIGDGSTPSYMFYCSFGRQFYSTENCSEHDASASWTQYASNWWAYKDKEAGHTWYVKQGVSGALAASWYRFPLTKYTKTTTNYTYYCFTVN